MGDENEVREHHPAVEGVLKYFSYEHLPEPLRSISEKICHLAHEMATDRRMVGAELTVGLRKLLEAKDCFVRAALDQKAAEARAVVTPNPER